MPTTSSLPLSSHHLESPTCRSHRISRRPHKVRIQPYSVQRACRREIAGHGNRVDMTKGYVYNISPVTPSSSVHVHILGDIHRLGECESALLSGEFRIPVARCCCGDNDHTTPVDRIPSVHFGYRYQPNRPQTLRAPNAEC